MQGVFQPKGLGLGLALKMLFEIILSQPIACTTFLAQGQKLPHPFGTLISDNDLDIPIQLTRFILNQY